MLVSCDQAGDQTSSSSKPNHYTIAVIPKGTTHEFWKSVHAGAVKAAHEINEGSKSGAPTVELIWKGPLKEDNREEQVKVVEDFITRGVSGILLSPLDESALRPVVQSATRSGIPVVIFDSGLKSDDYVSFVATDNHKGGKLAAQEMNRQLGGKGKILMLRYSEGSQSTMERERAFLEEIAQYPEITAVSANQYAGVTTELAYAASENLLAPYKTSDGNISVDGIFTPCEPVTFGMLRALQESGLAKKVVSVGFDSSEKMVQALEKGELNALVLQDPIEIGYRGVLTLVDSLSGKVPPKFIDTGVTVVTQDTMHDPKNAALLNPDFETWLK